jgi:hypothetical protein
MHVGRIPLLRPAVWLGALLFAATLLTDALPGQAVTPRPDRYFDLFYTMGYRFIDVSGSRDRYDTDYNLDDGFRLSNLQLDGHFLDPGPLPDRIRIETNNLADPYARHRFEFEKNESYKGSAALRRNRNTYRASGDFHRVDRKTQVASYDLAVPIGDAELFAGFSRSSIDGFWLTNRVGNRNLTPLYTITNVSSPRRLSEDEGELGVTVHARDTTLTLVGEYLDQNEDNRWTYSQPSVGNPAFLETENTSSGSSLEGPGARINLSHTAGRFDASIDGRWLDRRRRIVGGGTGSGFDTSNYTSTTNSIANGAARTALLDGTLTYELADTLTLSSDLRYLDHQEHLFIDQTDVTVYPALSSSVAVRTLRDQRTVSRLREASAELDWEAVEGLTLTGGWGWSQEKLRVPDLEPLDADFSRGTVVENGYIVGANWRADAHWTVKTLYRDFGQGGLQMHEVVDRRTRGVRSSLGYRDDTLWCEFGVDHFRSQNPVSSSRTARTAYTLSAGYTPDADLNWHGSYTLSDTDSRTRTNFYFDPSPTPVSTVVGFQGESQTVNTGLDWQISDRVRSSLFGAYTTVHGDFELDMYHWGIDLAWLIEQRGSVGIRVEQMDYHEAGNPDDYDAWMTYIYMSAQIRGQRR